MDTFIEKKKLDYITRIESYSVERKAEQMKPHLNSLDPDFYFDVHQIAHTHKYQSAKQDYKPDYFH